MDTKEYISVDKAKQKQNKEIKGRLRELVEVWKREQGTGNYLSNDAIADWFQENTGIVMQGRTVRNYLDESNPNAVPLPFLCWCAEKRGVSLDYLITGKGRPQKVNTNTGAPAAADVLDALRLLLETFWNSPVIEFDPYEYEISILDTKNNLLTTTTETFFSMSINSEVIQHQIKNWVRMVEILDSREDDEDDAKKLKELLFVNEFEAYRKYYDSIAEGSGVFYKASDNPVFIKPALSYAVPYTIPGKYAELIKDIKVVSEHGEPLQCGILKIPTLKEADNKDQKERDGETK